MPTKQRSQAQQAVIDKQRAPKREAPIPNKLSASGRGCNRKPPPLSVDDIRYYCQRGGITLAVRGEMLQIDDPASLMTEWLRDAMEANREPLCDRLRIIQRFERIEAAMTLLRAHTAYAGRTRADCLDDIEQRIADLAEYCHTEGHAGRLPGGTQDGFHDALDPFAITWCQDLRLLFAELCSGDYPLSVDDTRPRNRFGQVIQERGRFKLRRTEVS